MAQILANKIVLFGTFALPAGVIVYATSSLVTDILCEFYGKRKALEAVWGGFLASVLLVIAVEIAIAWPPAPFWPGQEAFQSTLQLTGRIVLGEFDGLHHLAKLGRPRVPQTQRKDGG
jgi:uncharacterized integral membrane protein (TIGR00697 family)